jgi:hypothetical protein
MPANAGMMTPTPIARQRHPLRGSGKRKRTDAFFLGRSALDGFG